MGVAWVRPGAPGEKSKKCPSRRQKRSSVDVVWTVATPMAEPAYLSRRSQRALERWESERTAPLPPPRTRQRHLEANSRDEATLHQHNTWDDVEPVYLPRVPKGRV